MRRSFWAGRILALVIWTSVADAHDIPNERVDRSIQAILSPGRLHVDYEVSLAELTLAQDLRRLVGDLPGADRRGWFEAYGKEVGPLNAKGLLVSVDAEEIDWKPAGFDLAVEGHPRYTFHFEAVVPSRGTLTLIDTNYAASEGTSRLAIRPSAGVEVRGDTLPVDVSEIPIRPVWQMSDEEERRTRRLTIDFSSSLSPRSTSTPLLTTSKVIFPTSSSLSGLLDDEAGRAGPVLLLIAFFLGAAHAIQPGHGKTLVAASTVGPGGSPMRGALLGLVAAIAHLASVTLIALALGIAGSARPGAIHVTLSRLTGFAIAAIGLWRVGRHLGGFGEHATNEAPTARSFRGLLALGIAGGAVPCWDAVALVVVSRTIGRPGLGLVLLATFSAGMAAVLVLVGAAASRIQALLGRSRAREVWERRLGLLGGLILTGIGIVLLR